MKKIFYFFGILLVIYIIFFDLQVGTIPTKHITTVATESKSDHTSKSLPNFEEIQVKNGDTVLGIVEELNPEFNQPISQITKDFTELNKGLSPTKIQSGKSYKFPLYSSNK